MRIRNFLLLTDKQEILERSVSMQFLAIAYVLSASLASAYDLPDNLQKIYNNHKVRDILSTK